MLRKLLTALLALCLVYGAACAETTVSVKELDVRDIQAVNGQELFILEGEDKLEYVADRDLNRLSAGYENLTYDINGAFVAKTGDYKEGTVGLDGQAMIPQEYPDVEVLNDRWGIGINLKESTEDDYEYKLNIIHLDGTDNETKFYLVDTADVYYRAEKLGTLSREEFKSAEAYGDYLRVRDRADGNTYYNKAFEKAATDPGESGEYSQKGGVVTHTGTNTEAFTAGCALTKEEVRQYIFIKDKQLLDLQGNVLADLSEYDYASVMVAENMVSVKNKDGKKALMDDEGKLLTGWYDETDFMVDTAKATGWYNVVQDGKTGFVNIRDGREGGFEFAKDDARVKGVFVTVEGEDGVHAATPAGKLDATYAKLSPANTAPYAVAEDAEGKLTVIGINGENVLPDLPEVRYDSQITFFCDGTMILVYTADGRRLLYTVAYDPAE